MQHGRPGGRGYHRVAERGQTEVVRFAQLLDPMLRGLETTAPAKEYAYPNHVKHVFGIL